MKNINKYNQYMYALGLEIFCRHNFILTLINGSLLPGAVIDFDNKLKDISVVTYTWICLQNARLHILDTL